MLGLVAPCGTLMKKAWTIATNCSELRIALSAYRCDGSHPHRKIEGALTELSGFYPEPMAVVIHQALGEWWDQVLAKPTEIGGISVKAMDDILLRTVGTMAHHIKNNHKPFRKDCPACQAGHGRSRRHMRRDYKEPEVLAVDLAGPIKEGGDGSRFFLVGAYTLIVAVNEPEVPPGGEEPAEVVPVVGAEAPDHPTVSVSALKVWTSVALNATCFRTRSGDGPPWYQVVRRRSLDNDTGAVLEETDTPQTDTRHWLYRRIPGGPTNLKTELYYDTSIKPAKATSLPAAPVGAVEQPVAPLEPLPPEVVAENLDEPAMADEEEEAAQDNLSEEEAFDAEPVGSQQHEPQEEPHIVGPHTVRTIYMLITLPRKTETHDVAGSSGHEDPTGESRMHCHAHSLGPRHRVHQ